MSEAKATHPQSFNKRHGLAGACSHKYNLASTPDALIEAAVPSKVHPWIVTQALSAQAEGELKGFEHFIFLLVLAFLGVGIGISLSLGRLIFIQMNALERLLAIVLSGILALAAAASIAVIFGWL